MSELEAFLNVSPEQTTHSWPWPVRIKYILWKKQCLFLIRSLKIKKKKGMEKGSASLFNLSRRTSFHLLLSPTDWLSFYCKKLLVQLLSRVWLFVTLQTTTLQTSLSFTVSQGLLRFMSTESILPSNHLILCYRVPCFKYGPHSTPFWYPFSHDSQCTTQRR